MKGRGLHHARTPAPGIRRGWTSRAISRTAFCTFAVQAAAERFYSGRILRKFRAGQKRRVPTQELISCGALGVPGERRRKTSPHAHLEALLRPGHQLAPLFDLCGRIGRSSIRTHFTGAWAPGASYREPSIPVFAPRFQNFQESCLHFPALNHCSCRYPCGFQRFVASPGRTLFNSRPSQIIEDQPRFILSHFHGRLQTETEEDRPHDLALQNLACGRRRTRDYQPCSAIGCSASQAIWQAV